MLAELRRRNVHRVAIAYLAGAWLLIQVADTVFPRIGVSESAITGLIWILVIGFIPALVLAWVFEWTSEGLRREADIAPETARPDSRLFDRIITVTLALAVVYFAVDKFIIDPGRDRAEIEAAAEQAAKRALSGAFLDEFRDRSILVLPFDNLSADPEQGFFADGLTEELLNLLAGIQELRVISRTTAWTFKGEKVDVAKIQRELDLSHLLQGSVRKAGDKIRITAQLIDARTNSHVWSETFDREFRDILDIQDEISAAVVEQLQLTILADRPVTEKIDSHAYELFLQARKSLESEETIRLLNEVLAIEPHYLPALYELAVAYETTGKQADPELQPFYRGRASEIVDRLISIAPQSIYASNWQAFIALNWDKDLRAAAPYLEDLSSYLGRTDAPVWEGGIIYLLIELERYDEAIAVAQFQASRNPACGNCIDRLAYAMRQAGRHHEAALVLETLSRWRTPTPNNYWYMGVVRLVAGDAEKALEHFDNQGDPPGANLGRLLALHSLNRSDEFADEFARFRQRDGHEESIARVYAWMHDTDSAFEWLEKTIERQGEKYAALVNTELYEPIKTDPRWQQFLDKYGVVDEALPDIEFNPVYPPAIQRAVDAM